MSTKRPLLGILGGMGTQATASFYEKLHRLQKVKCEQEYLDIILYSKPSIPDRTAFITKQSSENPLDSLVCAAKTLESSGVSCIAIPCATAHFFYDELSNTVDVPIINMIDETARFIVSEGYKNICLLATDGSLRSRVFQASFEKHGINALCNNSPDIADLQAELMSLIYDVKRGNATETDVNELLNKVVEQSLGCGADAIVLGCTELCISINETPNVINTLEVLSRAVLNKLH
ncbi:MAG: amino acid racemase [Oscillospiraceae bacterium]|nr:amino acid racemase [Oscillospiraceae bacterium]